MDDYQAVLKSVLNGDKHAFDELVRAFEGLAVLEASKHLKDKDLRKDAVQEAFIYVYLHLSDLNNLSAFPSWFKKIIRTCSRKIRNKYPSNFIETSSLLDLADLSPTPYESLTRFEDCSMVRNILNSLKEDMRETFLQRYMHGRSYNDIADSSGLPLGTVKRRLYDARAKFIQHFKKQNNSIIRVGYLPISDHLLAMVSHQMHDQQEYSILLRKYLSWPSLVNSLRADQLDVAFIMAPLALSLRAAGMPITYILNAHQNGSAITVRKDASYTWKHIQGCMGLPHEISTQNMILHHMFDGQASDAIKTIKPTYLSPSYVNKSLVSQNIDSFFCAEPWNTKAVMNGIGRIVVQSGEICPGHICCILIAKESFAAQQGDILRQYIKLLSAANEHIGSKPDFCAKTQAKYTGVSADVVETVIKNKTITYNDLTPEKSGIESVMNLSIKAGILKKPCNIDSFMCTSFL